MKQFTQTFVPPAPAPAPLPAQQTREAASIWMSGVVAPFVQNIIGGIGVAVIAGLLGLAIAPANPVLIGKAATIAGAVVFGGQHQRGHTDGGQRLAAVEASDGRQSHAVGGFGHAAHDGSRR